MSFLGMNPDVAEDVYNRLSSTSARATLTGARSKLQHMVAVSHNPNGYGIEAGERILTPYSITHANNAIRAITGALGGLDTVIATLGAEVVSQRDASTGRTVFNYTWPFLDVFLPYPRIARVYGSGSNRTYGSFFRNPNDPRRNWRVQRPTLTYRGPWNSDTRVSRISNTVSTWWDSKSGSWIKRTSTAVVNRVTSVAGNLVSRIPSAAVRTGLRVGVRALGPIGTVVGIVFAAKDGYDKQVALDEGRDFTDAEKEGRAATRATINAVASTAGAVALGAVGAAVGGPVGAVLGGMLGGFLGGLLGDAISDAVLD
jgi:hypothetical protein